MRSREAAEALLDKLPEPAGWPGDVAVQGVHVTSSAPSWSFEDEAKRNAPVRIIPINTLYTTQPTVGREHVRKLLREPWSDLPLVMPWQGRWALQDGHHRITAAVLRGARLVKVRVVWPEDRLAPMGARRLPNLNLGF
jgi:hypothetical protein